MRPRNPNQQQNLQRRNPMANKPKSKREVKLVIKGSILEVWDKLRALPEFNNNMDLLRDMIREFAAKRRII